MSTVRSATSDASLEATLVGPAAFSLAPPLPPPAFAPPKPAEAPVLPPAASVSAPQEVRPVPVLNADAGRRRGPNGTMIQQRLRAASVILIVGLAVDFLRALLIGETGTTWLRAGVLVSSVTCLTILTGRARLSLSRLRLLEGLLFGPPVVQVILIQTLQVIAAGRLEDELGIADVVHEGTTSLIFLMMAYALFMPNTWRRAAPLLVPMAVGPVLGLGYARWADSFAREVLTVGTLCEVGLAMSVTLFASLWGIVTISALRQEVHRARQLGQYRLKRLLSTGGMGEVYLAEHRLLTRPCAVKLIRNAQHADPLAMARFEREVRSMARLSHWNTVEIYDFGHADDGTFYYVMEYLPGMNLWQLVSRFGALPPERVLHFLLQTCRALHEAHQLGLVHRDLKPANIFASKRGGEYDVAKLLDFGLVQFSPTATRASTAETANLRFAETQLPETLAGSPLFMSPEQASAESTPDCRSDIYSLGATAYFLLTGRPPFEGNSAVKLLIAHARDPVVPPTKWNPAIPKDLEAIVLRCLEKDPGDRPATARQLEEELARCRLSREWTPERAKSWWDSFHPEIDRPLELQR